MKNSPCALSRKSITVTSAQKRQCRSLMGREEDNIYWHRSYLFNNQSNSLEKWQNPFSSQSAKLNVQRRSINHLQRIPNVASLSLSLSLSPFLSQKRPSILDFPTYILVLSTLMLCNVKLNLSQHELTSWVIRPVPRGKLLQASPKPPPDATTTNVVPLQKCVTLIFQANTPSESLIAHLYRDWSSISEKPLSAFVHVT